MTDLSLQTLPDPHVDQRATEQVRNRIFVYDAYLRILNEGTEPGPEVPT